MNRRELLQAGLWGTAALVGTSAAGVPEMTGAFAFLEASILQLQAALMSGKLTSRSLTAAYLGRIDALNTKGPAIRAVIEVNPDAESIAEALDQERQQKGPRGPLHGIPVLIKDNIDTADKMATTAGSLALVGSPPASDAFVVARLRASGAVLLGKTNLSEWANFRSTRSSSGWSARGGQTLNPYALDRTPSGSSSGSAAAVTANLCAVAVGTETDGSVIGPSSTQGIVGLKPTVGLVSRTGIIPISASQDTAGPMGRSVQDVAVLLNAMVGADPSDPATQAASQRKPAGDYTRFLKSDGLRGARLGVVRALFGSHERVNALAELALAKLKSLGAELVDVELPASKELDDAELEVLLFEFKAGLNGYLSRRPQAKVKTLAGVIEFNRQNASRELRGFGQELLEKAESKGPLNTPAYLAAVKTCRRLTRTEGIDVALGHHRLDALITISAAPAFLIDPIHGDRSVAYGTSPAAVAGYPSITVPMGDLSGLPVGLLFFGTAWSEPTLLRLAYAFEQATHHRKAPRFLPTLGADPG